MVPWKVHGGYSSLHLEYQPLTSLIKPSSLMYFLDFVSGHHISLSSYLTDHFSSFFAGFPPLLASLMLMLSWCIFQVNCVKCTSNHSSQYINYTLGRLIKRCHEFKINPNDRQFHKNKAIHLSVPYFLKLRTCNHFVDQSCQKEKIRAVLAGIKLIASTVSYHKVLMHCSPSLIIAKLMDGFVSVWGLRGGQHVAVPLAVPPDP